MPRPFRFQVSAHGRPTAAAWRALARKAEDLGYSSLAIADHLDDQFAPLPALMAAADATTTLRIATLVLANDYRHPAMVAKELATLDVLSEGRLEIGIGAGWLATDYAQAAIPLDRPGVRIERLAESIEVMRALFGESPATFHGTHYNIDALNGLPKPVQRPHPPILVAGGGRNVLRLAARVADIVGVNINLASGAIDASVGPNVTHDATMEKLAWIRDAAGARFDDIELQVRAQIAMVHPKPRELAEQIAPTLGITPEDALSSPHALVGSVDQIVDALLERRERYGFSYINWHDDAMETLAPVVARLAGR